MPIITITNCQARSHSRRALILRSLTPLPLVQFLPRNVFATQCARQRQQCCHHNNAAGPRRACDQSSLSRWHGYNPAMGGPRVPRAPCRVPRARENHDTVNANHQPERVLRYEKSRGTSSVHLEQCPGSRGDGINARFLIATLA